MAHPNTLNDTPGPHEPGRPQPRNPTTPGDLRWRASPPGSCHAAREHGSTCQVSALPHGAAARTTVCMFGFLKPSDRSSGLRSFGLSEADHSGSLSGSRPMQQRLVCVVAGQTFSIQRMEVYAAGQQHFLPPHTRKDTGSIPVGTTHRLSAPAAGSAIRPSRRAPYRVIWLIGSFDTVAPYTSSRCGYLTGGQTLCRQ